MRTKILAEAMMILVLVDVQINIRTLRPCCIVLLIGTAGLEYVLITVIGVKAKADSMDSVGVDLEDVNVQLR